MESDYHYIGHLDGKLYVNDTEEPYDVDSYCIEFIDVGTIEVSINAHLSPTDGRTDRKTFSFRFHSQLEAFVCFAQEVAKFRYYPYGLTVSCIFLGITLIVYLCLPKVSVALWRLCAFYFSF